jgi:predicted Zn-dependent protease
MRKIVLQLAIALLALTLGTAYASDNGTLQHWHDYQNITWNYDSWSSDSTWELAVESAFVAWEDAAALVDFTKVTGTSQIDVSKGLAADGDCPENAVACAEWWFYPIVDHDYDANIWFNTDESWGSGICNYVSGPSRYSVALHEIGHAAGNLNHSSDSDAIMYAFYSSGECNLLTAHDVNSMYAQYSSH